MRKNELCVFSTLIKMKWLSKIWQFYHQIFWRDLLHWMRHFTRNKPCLCKRTCVTWHVHTRLFDMIALCIFLYVICTNLPTHEPYILAFLFLCVFYNGFANNAALFMSTKKNTERTFQLFCIWPYIGYIYKYEWDLRIHCDCRVLLNIIIIVESFFLPFSIVFRFIFFM